MKAFRLICSLIWVVLLVLIFLPARAAASAGASG
jgi:hypothetical protein